MNLWMDVSLQEAVAMPRLHHQFIPNNISINEEKPFRVDKAVQVGLEKKGHVFKLSKGKSVVQAASHKHDEGFVSGASDPRKGGKAWGF